MATPRDASEPPDFAAGSELLANAYRFACRAHHGPAREGDTDIEHPVAVAELLAEAGFAETVVAAALLHDVVEDTSYPESEITQRFQVEIAGLVAVMTEDESIADYSERKREHRERVLAAGRVPASIYLADKLARVRRYASIDEPVDPLRLQHYRDTLGLYDGADSSLPFLAELRSELPALRPGSE